MYIVQLEFRHVVTFSSFSISFSSLRRLHLRSRAALCTHCSPLNPATSAKVHNTWPPSVRVREVTAAPKVCCRERFREIIRSKSVRDRAARPPPRPDDLIELSASTYIDQLQRLKVMDSEMPYRFREAIALIDSRKATRDAGCYKTGASLQRGGELTLTLVMGA